MDTGRLKRFATEARNILMTGVKQRLQALGFDLKTGTASEMPQAMEGGAVFMGDVVSADFYKKWMSLYNNIQARKIKEVAEEAAYTWFNRFMAIRIMEKQDFISPVLSFESEDVKIPVIVSEARQGRMPTMTEAERSQLMELLEDDCKTSEQFALLIVAYCHENAIINNCFGNIADYTELLLPQNILSEGGFEHMLNNTEFISEEDYKSPELIGWLYQFYISDRKDEAFAKKGKYDPDEIAPATQIFTPNWIVKYMAENTLGRIYIDNNPYCELKDDLKYLVDVKPSSEPMKVEDLAELKCADLACGSGHILNECFDLLYKMYIEEGYSRRKAIEDILSKNLLGIDLDTRAKQLATFALLMKACQKDQSFLDGKVMPRVYNMPRPIAEIIPSDWSTQDSAEFLRDSIPHYMMGSNTEMTKEILDAILLMNYADTLGSIMKFNISESTRNAIMVRTQEYEAQLANGEFVAKKNLLFIPYMNIILALTEKYAAICMNPPYMGSGRFDNVLSKYVKDNYPRSKADLMSVFMDVAIDRLTPNGKYGMINMHSWMFLSSFEELRCNLLDNQTIDSLLHLGPRTFDELSGEVVQNAAFVISNAKLDKNQSNFYRLVDGCNCSNKRDIYLECRTASTVHYSKDIATFKKLPGSIICYWISSKITSIFTSNEPLLEIATPCVGLQTGDNGRFVRTWHEINIKQFGAGFRNAESATFSQKKWFPYNKGGGSRRWYGNITNIVNWENNGQEIKSFNGSVVRNPDYYFQSSISWSIISSTSTSFRYYPYGFLFDVGGMSCFANNDDDKYVLLGTLNTKLYSSLAKIINPTVNLQTGDVAKLPINIKECQFIIPIVKQCVSIAKSDWDSHETSWDFQTNELISLLNRGLGTITVSCDGEEVSKFTNLDLLVAEYKIKWSNLHSQLHQNEEELNRHFIEIYGLQDELTPDVPLDEITILQQGEISINDGKIIWHDDVIMKQLISYAVGCMMGRYSIDKPGLILANQGDDLKEYEALVPNSRFEVDVDGIIPLMSSNTEFADNATLRFWQWLTVTFGAESLVDNLNFIEAALGKSLDDYFVKDFWKDHKKMYQNRPIYWLFSSKRGAFQCLAYMHRMNPYTAESIRTKYLLPHIEWLIQKQSEMEANAANLSTAERRELDRLTTQIAECREYHDRLHVIADEQIAFDLDDGVVVNYAKFGDVLQKLK